MTNQVLVRYGKLLRQGALSAGAVFALAVCTHTYHLVPGPGAVAPQTPGPAVAGEGGGVRLLADPRRWAGDPPTLSQYVLPVWVEIENHSGKALLLRYSDITLSGAGGNTLRAIPPFKVHGNAIVSPSAVRPEFHAKGFFVAPYLGPFYTGLDDPWQGALIEPDMDYYLAHHVYWEEPMPTDDMLRQAVPEGVLSDGGKVSGFIYFQRITRGSPGLTLRSELVDVTTRQSSGRIEIPFAVVKD